MPPYVNGHRRAPPPRYPRGAREEPREAGNGPLPRRRRITFDLSLLQTVLLVVLVFVALLWMFALGLTVGRQFPEDAEKLSPIQKIAVALGYHPTEPDAGKTQSLSSSPTPAEMQLALTYHRELTTPSPALGPPAPEKPPTPPQKKQPPPEQPAPPPQSPPVSKEEKEAISREIPAKTENIETTGERYTLLVASFKSIENAAKLEQTLRAKGYNVSREETRINNETWYRITVGTFDNREVAMRFMGMFNEKERLKGVLIRR